MGVFQWMSVRIDGGGLLRGYPPGLRPSALRSNRLWAKGGRSRPPRLKKKGLNNTNTLATSLTINVEQEVVTEDVEGQKAEVSTNKGGFVQGAAALNGIVLTMMTIIIAERQDPTQCQRTIRTDVGGTQREIMDIQVIWACAIVNVVVGIYPSVLAYVWTSESDGSSRVILKNVQILCMLSWLTSLSLKQTILSYQLLLTSVLALVASTAWWGLNRLHLLLVGACMSVSTIQALVGGEGWVWSLRALLVLWWALGICTVVEWNGAVQVSNSIVLMQLSMLWLVSMECWVI